MSTMSAMSCYISKVQDAQSSKQWFPQLLCSNWLPVFEHGNHIPRRINALIC